MRERGSERERERQRDREREERREGVREIRREGESEGDKSVCTCGYCHRDSQRQTFFQTFTIVSSIPSCPAPASLVSENIRYSYKQKNKLRDIQYTSKRIQQFVKFVRCLLIRTRATLLWFATGFVQEMLGMELQHFLPNTPQFGTFSRQKCAAILGLWCFTRRRIGLIRSQ